MSKGFASSSRQLILASVVLASFVALGTRLVWLQVIDREELLRVVAQARRKIDEVPARRGNIVDSRGAILATSRSLIMLGVDPQMLRDEDRKKWPQLAALLDLPLPELAKKFNTKSRPAAPANTVPAASPTAQPAGLVFNLNAPSAVAAPDSSSENDDTALDEGVDASGNHRIRYAELSRTVSESTFAEIKALGIAGVVDHRIYRRSYPHNTLAAHLVGYVNREESPVTGIERYADFYLHGRNGWLESEKDGKRQELAQFRTREVAAADGYSVQLSIDSTIQLMVEDELAALAAKYQPQKATIIVSDPRTGFILALGNYPTFDLNTYNKLSKEEQDRSMRNIAVTDQYEPGSVFKIVAASAALNEGLVTPATSFDCSLASIEYLGKKRDLPEEAHHFGRLTVAEIIAHSSNKGAAQLAMQLGNDRFMAYARAFGFGQRTGFPVGGEIPGTLKAVKDWDGLTITRMPMGHSIDATPIQMHQAMSAIASGGLLVRPSLIRQIKDASGEIIFRSEGKSGDRIITERTAQTMATLLMGVVSKDGTAPEVAIENYQVAGKTGTSQKLIRTTDSTGRVTAAYSHKNHVCSFVGFFPASAPQVAISVIVDDADARCPGGIAAGAKVAGPSFKHLAEQLIQYLEIKPVFDHVPAAAPSLLAQQGGRR